jgi:hypothetical protein
LAWLHRTQVWLKRTDQIYSFSQWLWWRPAMSICQTHVQPKLGWYIYKLASMSTHSYMLGQKNTVCGNMRKIRGLLGIYIQSGLGRIKNSVSTRHAFYWTNKAQAERNQKKGVATKWVSMKEACLPINTHSLRPSVPEICRNVWWFCVACQEVLLSPYFCHVICLVNVNWFIFSPIARCL